MTDQSEKASIEPIVNLVGQWLEERRLLLAMYGDLANVKPFSAQNTMHRESLREFCQAMVDYLSRVHFEVFEKFNQSQNLFSKEKSNNLLGDLTKRVELTTDHFLDFNDKYLATDDLATLTSDLSILGEELAKRFELEDKVIALVRQAISSSDEN
tara:strand:- start:785 stop:1249 length:465 start_codon:yes stop_codon:yes gene_type:complete